MRIQEVAIVKTTAKTIDIEKLLPRLKEISLQFPAVAAAYLREAIGGQPPKPPGFNALVLPGMPIRKPRCKYTTASPAEPHWALRLFPNSALSSRWVRALIRYSVRFEPGKQLRHQFVFVFFHRHRASSW